MSIVFPHASRIELPILQELVATGGSEDVRYLYRRLVGYFPQFAESDADFQASAHWRRHVQRAGRLLDDLRQITRDRRGRWEITATGRRRVADEDSRFTLEPASAATSAPSGATLGHAEIQEMLLDIGRALGYHVEREHNYYDVVWRASERSPRLSHVFEVQRRGNLDSALAKLKRAYESQRSKPFLVVATERDDRRARRSIDEATSGAFHEIGTATRIISFEQLGRLHRSLAGVRDTLAALLDDR